MQRKATEDINPGPNKVPRVDTTLSQTPTPRAVLPDQPSLNNEYSNSVNTLYSIIKSHPELSEPKNHFCNEPKIKVTDDSMVIQFGAVSIHFTNADVEYGAKCNITPKIILVPTNMVTEAHVLELINTVIRGLNKMKLLARLHTLYYNMSVRDYHISAITEARDAFMSKFIEEFQSKYTSQLPGYLEKVREYLDTIRLRINQLRYHIINYIKKVLDADLSLVEVENFEISMRSIIDNDILRLMNPIYESLLPHKCNDRHHEENIITVQSILDACPKRYKRLSKMGFYHLLVDLDRNDIDKAYDMFVEAYIKALRIELEFKLKDYNLITKDELKEGTANDSENYFYAFDEDQLKKQALKEVENFINQYRLED